MHSNLCNRFIIGVIRDFWTFSEISIGGNNLTHQPTAGVNQDLSTSLCKFLIFEGNRADPGGGDEVGIMHRVDIFMHAHGHKRLEN